MEEGLVFGMGDEPVAKPDFPALRLDEVNAVLSVPAVEIEWRSPRPLSTTARVRTADGGLLIVKRLPDSLRTPGALAEEHGFMDHLRGRGIPVPEAWTAGAGGGSVYEVQRLGTGGDLYQGTFSWSPYLNQNQACLAAAMLARLHDASRDYQAPARPYRPLKAGFSLFGGDDPVAAIEAVLDRRPALADFLGARDWRGDVERVLLPAHAALRPLLDDLEPLWTHNDWHGTNLLWSGPDPLQKPTSVFDFGLADRTFAVHDVAVAVDRFALDWLALRRGEKPAVQRRQLRDFFMGYLRKGKLSPADRAALPLIFPLVHAEYELSEIDYFVGVVPGGNFENAEIAYRDYFLGHAEWTKTEEGRAFLGHLSEL